MKTVLIVEDDSHLRQLLALEFELTAGCRTITASGAFEAIRQFQNHAFDLIITDLRMPDGSGLDLLAWVHRNVANPPPAILMSGMGDHQDMRFSYGGYLDVLPKPFDWDILEKKVAAVLSQHLNYASGTALPSAERDEAAPLLEQTSG